MEALGDLEVLGCAAEELLRVEVGRLDHQRVAHPLAERDAHVRAHLPGRRLALSHADDARVVHHFRHDEDVILVLHDGVVVVVEVIRQHRRPGVRSERHDAALGDGPVFGVVETPERRDAAESLGLSLSTVGSEIGDAAVGWIDDDRAAALAVHDRHVVARVDPEIIVAADVAGRAGGPVAPFGRGLAIRVTLSGELLRGVGANFLEPLDLRRRQRLGESRRSLERRKRAVGPVALQVGMAVGGARDGPRFGARGLCWQR